MKTKTIKTLFVSAYCSALAALMLAAPANAADKEPVPSAFDRPSVYPAAIAVRSNEAGADDIWTITGETASGLSYTWYMEDACDIFTGDLMAVLMDDAGTPDSVLDDQVIYAAYAGPAGW